VRSTSVASQDDLALISRYAEFAGITVALPPGTVYAILDGLFQQPC